MSLGLILYFAIHFTGAGWNGLDDAAVFGLVGVAVQAVGFVVLDLLIPGKLGKHCFEPHACTPPRGPAPGFRSSVALVVCASLT